MSERKKDFLFLTVLLGVLVISFSSILFSDRIVRAPDIINEFYWGLLHYQDMAFWDIFKVNLTATWNQFINSGLNAGDRVIVDNLIKMSQGAPVKISEASAPARGVVSGKDLKSPTSPAKQ